MRRVEALHKEATAELGIMVWEQSVLDRQARAEEEAMEREEAEEKQEEMLEELAKLRAEVEEAKKQAPGSTKVDVETADEKKETE